MAYHIIITSNSLPDDFTLDVYLGSAHGTDFYWDSVGRELNLPIISSILERADSEEDTSLRSADLINFKKEMEIFENYWLSGKSAKGFPEDFLPKIKKVKDGIDYAINHKLTLMFA